MEFKKLKEWAETATVFQGIFVLLGGAVSGRLTALLGAPLYMAFTCFLLGMIAFLLLVIFYKRNDPEKAWVFKGLVIVVLLGAVLVIDNKASVWIAKYLFSPEQQIRTWLDELHMKSELIVPPPEGQVFHFKVSNVKDNKSFILYQEKTDPDTIVFASRILIHNFFNALPANQRERVWIDMALALIRSDIKIAPVARYGQLEVSNWVPFGPQTTRQQFINETRRLHIAIESVNIFVAHYGLNEPKQ